jgi:hypothetical protein
VVSRFLPVYCLVVGAMDLVTGLLLIGATESTLRLMGIAVTPAEPIYLRFVGVFVAATGSLYLLPFVSRSLPARRLRERATLEATALVRACVAAFVTISIASGALEPAWVSVALADGALALAQLLVLRRSGGHAS